MYKELIKRDLVNKVVITMTENDFDILTSIVERLYTLRDNREEFFDSDLEIVKSLLERPN
jgi:hypothetical protein